MDPSKTLLQYQYTPCPLCSVSEMPDRETLRMLIEEAVMTHPEENDLEYFDNDTILIVNNYLSLSICYQTLLEQKTLGVDLEGSLRIGGSINLIQIACERVVFIIDIYQINKINNDENLLNLVSSVLKSAFLDDRIRKVFFDGKKDLEALHYLLNVGTRNFIDAQAVHMTYF